MCNPMLIEISRELVGKQLEEMFQLLQNRKEHLTLPGEGGVAIIQSMLDTRRVVVVLSAGQRKIDELPSLDQVVKDQKSAMLIEISSELSDKPLEEIVKYLEDRKKFLILKPGNEVDAVITQAMLDASLEEMLGEMK